MATTLDSSSFFSLQAGEKRTVKKIKISSQTASEILFTLDCVQGNITLGRRNRTSSTQ